MKTKPSSFTPTLIIADDAALAALLCCALARSGSYLPVVEGPRLGRPDRDAEIVRRSNAAARAGAQSIFLAGLPDHSSEALTNHFARGKRWKIHYVKTAHDINAITRRAPSSSEAPLIWGRNRLGVGLLKALRTNTEILFSDDASPVEHVPTKSNHLVVCEDGDDLSQVIAANYAHYLRAGLYLIPEIDEMESERILEEFYNIYEQREKSPTDVLEGLKVRLRNFCGVLPIPPNGSVTFVSRKLPYGFGFSEVPSTHLFKCSDLGIAVINGLAADQPGRRGISVAVLVDPKKAHAPEIAEAEQILSQRGVFLRCYHERGASVREVADMIELFPYDLLIISTHCGDVPGHRWTYKFSDSEGIDRTLVVDIAIGIARTDEPEMYKVTLLNRFVSLDGIDWNDPLKKGELYVGTAINDFLERTKAGLDVDLQPVKKESVPRVIGSAALAMNDHNYIPHIRSLAAEGTPIIINNACVSWHTLAEIYTFNNARAYLGTLFPVSTSEAHDVVIKLLAKHFNKPLAAALWSSQREVYGVSVRRPYIMTGVYHQHLRITGQDVPRYIVSRLSEALAEWKMRLRNLPSEEERKTIAIKEHIAFYERELSSFRKRWPIEDLATLKSNKGKVIKRVVEWD